MNEIQQKRYDSISSMGTRSLIALAKAVNDSMLDDELKHHFMKAINARAIMVDVASAIIENEEPVHID